MAAAPVLVPALLARGAAAEQVRPMDLLPYLTDSPPTTEVEVKLCNVFKVVEKPYYILFGSCWVCALAQQLIDTTRYYEDRKEELGFYQKCYLAVQLGTLVAETLELWSRMGWMDGASIWDLYNLYVYMFVHSSVFVRSVMMTMIIWDWYEAKLLKRPVSGSPMLGIPVMDGKGWSDDERASLLVVILQFGSSAGIFGVILVTHLLPGLALFFWIFLFAAGFIIKIRGWLEAFGIEPDGRFGRGFVMACNSFVAVVALQTMITGMVRVYAGVWSKGGYFTPVMDDLSSRHLTTWYECHLLRGFKAALRDQDFLNLFVR